MRDVHLALGRGLAVTWPNGTSIAPPILIDHVLVSREIAIASVREGRGAGSNHRPVIAELVLSEGD
jgi:endonuclease/exonuclease/phosphatase (EEP) superfamily protein YafD